MTDMQVIPTSEQNLKRLSYTKSNFYWDSRLMEVLFFCADDIVNTTLCKNCMAIFCAYNLATSTCSNYERWMTISVVHVAVDYDILYQKIVRQGSDTFLWGWRRISLPCLCTTINMHASTCRNPEMKQSVKRKWTPKLYSCVCHVWHTWGLTTIDQYYRFDLLLHVPNSNQPASSPGRTNQPGLYPQFGYNFPPARVGRVVIGRPG